MAAEANLQASDQRNYEDGHPGCFWGGDCEGRTSLDYDNTALNGLRFKLSVSWERERERERKRERE